MAADAWLMSFSSCIVCGFDLYTVLFKCSQRTFLRGHLKSTYTNRIRTRYRNWRTTSAMQLQPSKSLCYIGYTSTWWQHDCWPAVQTLYAIYVLTPERTSKGHVQNGRWATFSWPTLYKHEQRNQFQSQHSHFILIIYTPGDVKGRNKTQTLNYYWSKRKFTYLTHYTS
jgi:hypothetical protein